MLRAFFAASCAAMTLSWWNLSGNGKLTMFNEPFANPPHFAEYPVFIMLGIVGGCIGASFVHFNIMVMKARAPGTPFRKRCHIILEVFCIAFLTGVTSYSLLWTRVLSNTTIRAMFHDCRDATVDEHTYLLDICEDGEPVLTLNFCLLIALAGFLRYVQMIFTFGTGCAAGLFIPALLIGSCLGRIAGIGAYLLNAQWPFTPVVHPGMYAMLGAAGVLGGVCRVTISLVVIMFELTGGLQLIVPFMIVCTLAKWVGDYFTIGIYDYIILVRRYPFLHEPDEVTYHTTAEDLMDEGVFCLHPALHTMTFLDGTAGTLDGLIAFFKNAKYGGFPLTQSTTDHTFLGYVHTDVISKVLDREKKAPFSNGSASVAFLDFMADEEKAKMSAEERRKVIDLSKYVDETVMTAVAKTPAVQLQSIFRNLGVRLILIRNKGNLVGIITKKAFIDHLEELHHPENSMGTVKSNGGLQEALLPK